MSEQDGRRLLKSCSACKARKTKCSGRPAPCEGCQRRNTKCQFRRMNIPRRPNANIDLITPAPPPPCDAMANTSPLHRLDLVLNKPVPELYIDRILAQTHAPEAPNYDMSCKVKLVENSSLTFFSDVRLHQLSTRLGNGKVKELVQHISSVIGSRVYQYDTVSSSSLRKTADAVATASARPREALFWIKSYFDQVHPLYPILDRKVFESVAFGSQLPNMLKNDKAWSALYHSVLALGCQVNGGGSFSPGKGDAWALFSISLSYFPDIVVLPDSLTVLQAMTAMAIYSLGTPCLAIEHVLLSEAARRAQTLSNTTLAGNADMTYRKVFWVLYMVEKASSFHFGRNSVFIDHDIVTPIPAVPEAVFNGFDWFLTSTKYSRLLSRAMTSLFSAGVLGSPRAHYLAVIDQLTEELEKWRLSIPVVFRPGDFNSHAASSFERLTRFASLWTTLLYNSFRASLCRSTLHLAAAEKDVGRQAESTRILMEVSRSTLEWTTLINVEPCTPFWIICGIPLTSHFLLFDMVINNPCIEETASNLALLDIAGGHFSKLEYVSSGTLPGSLLGGFGQIAREYVNSITQSDPRILDRQPFKPSCETTAPPKAYQSFSINRTNLFMDETTNAPMQSSGASAEMLMERCSTGELFLADRLCYSLNDNLDGAGIVKPMGTDIMDLFSTSIPGLDSIIFNQMVEDYMATPVQGEQPLL
ncbi:hypothetical protein GQ53DRAFT_841569 [Thozetella sp. PMI_491]|nr:hypothetical protein GQ53DRAFT_841569 [Thozetella sp. PMI_491]